ncbi:MAG: hypothetical protein J1F66_05880 [Clostridiales bacterium]|nr:hypothetical protein [Clostridiales bacterium]
MNNEFTVDEIKKSVEYQWRKWQIKLLLWSLLIIGIFTFFVFIIVFNIISNFDLQFLGLGIIVWLYSMVVCGLIFLPLGIFDYVKMRYLLKNYQKFNSYEVVLDNVTTSYWLRGAVYYTVIINDNGLSKKARTNPYFSSHFLSKYSLQDYNNKKVVGLFDEDMGKFYIVKKVDDISIYMKHK